MWRDALADRARVRAADIGCGDGRYDRLLFDHIPGLHLICVDSSGPMLERLSESLAGAGIRAFTTRLASVDALSFEGGIARRRPHLQRDPPFRRAGLSRHGSARARRRRTPVHLHPHARAERRQHMGAVLPGFHGERGPAAHRRTAGGMDRRNRPASRWSRPSRFATRGRRAWNACCSRRAAGTIRPSPSITSGRSRRPAGSSPSESAGHSTILTLSAGMTRTSCYT